MAAVGGYVAKLEQRLDTGEGLLLLGPPGLGKTLALSAIVNEACRSVAAVYAIFAFITIILAYLSVRIFRDIHPVVFGGTTEAAAGAAEGLQEFSGLDSARMGLTLLISVVAFTLLGSAWILVRVRLQNLMDFADGLKARVAARLRVGPRASTSAAIGALLLGLPLAQVQIDDPNRFNIYLIGGYAVMSSISLIYMLYLTARQRNLRNDIALLRQLLRED